MYKWVPLTSLFLIPLLEAPPPPPKTSSVDDRKAHEYTGNDGRGCCVCLGRMADGPEKVCYLLEGSRCSIQVQESSDVQFTRQRMGK